ncbi:MAG TPA: ATP-binding cassette domain-containing protein [Bryobacteraceae bacterium]|jgi:putative ABC transport system ATP-binding protein|nr:ATP-binding cassette domain-containing protein [Bryobacteraceae bacterium]
MSASSFIELVDVKKTYGSGVSAVPAIDGISLTAERGEWIAIMGPSGSGKTTLLNLIGCLDQATSGVLRVDGTDTSQLRPADLARFRSETVGFVFQQFHLVPHLTAIENVMLAQFFHSTTDEKSAMEALKQVGMEARATHLPAQLSGGEQQRVAIARALVNDPKIILADEPTGNLDAENQRGVFRILSSLHAEGRTIVMVTHDEAAGHLADRRINLDHGRIKETLVFSAEENQDFDEVLEHLWTRRESTDHMESTDFTEVQWRKLIGTLTRIGLVSVVDGEERFTPAGEERARNVIRRHRLAERLFMDVLSIRDEIEIESSACKFEHILSPDVTDRICTLLGHPVACPHGSPIPRGDCCIEKRVLDSSEIATVLGGIKNL